MGTAAPAVKHHIVFASIISVKHLQGGDVTALEGDEDVTFVEQRCDSDC
jgi:hypothetical protein